MKQFIIIALILIVSVSAKAQQQKTEKPLPVTINYRAALLILQYTSKVDSLLLRSEVPTNKTAPLLNVSPLIRSMLQQAYSEAVKADSIVTTKTKIKP